jgi:CubicO group peptidase (beta-lactamase class C family)
MTTFGAAFDRVRAHVTAGRLPSAVFGIATADGTVALDAFGATGSRTAHTDDRYPLFSITKPLVGIAAARAIERGLLSPLTPLSDAVPEFGRNRDDVVQLRHLVSHTSGIGEPPMDTPLALRTELVTRDRDFAAGTASRYSTVAFEGVAALIEHATGRHWTDEVTAWAEEIGASGLSLSLSDAHPVLDAAAAGLDMARFEALQHPGAGLGGRADDLLRLGAELLRIGRGERGILHPATHSMMLRPLTGDIPRLDPYTAERGQDWGFTWNLRTRAPGLIDRDTYGHGGWAGTQFWVQPSAGVVWVLLTNQEQQGGVDIDEIANAVTGAL